MMKRLLVMVVALTFVGVPSTQASGGHLPGVRTTIRKARHASHREKRHPEQTKSSQVKKHHKSTPPIGIQDGPNTMSGDTSTGTADLGLLNGDISAEDLELRPGPASSNRNEVKIRIPGRGFNSYSTEGITTGDGVIEITPDVNNDTSNGFVLGDLLHLPGDVTVESGNDVTGLGPNIRLPEDTSVEGLKSRLENTEHWLKLWQADGMNGMFVMVDDWFFMQTVPTAKDLEGASKKDVLEWFSRLRNQMLVSIAKRRDIPPEKETDAPTDNSINFPPTGIRPH